MKTRPGQKIKLTSVEELLGVVNEESAMDLEIEKIRPFKNRGVGIKKGDTIFMYVGAPVSAVLYQCKVTETDIPYEHENKYIAINALMRIRLQRRYPADRFTFEVLKSEYGIYAVRGPRGIPNSLSAALKK